jgi:Outer membrane receptor for ferric coprogen and ferric-rhodotorulic acid
MTKDKNLARYALGLASALMFSGAGFAQAQTAPAASADGDDSDEVIVLSPFEVSADDERGYTAATTLAGNRLNTELRDIGNAVTVITGQFLRDVQATNNETLLQYTAGTEVGNIRGNFAGLGDGSVLDETSRFSRPNQNTRVRGLAEADNTRDYFLSDIPWDAYNVDRVDLQRGPNSILFGLGSPAGLLNVGTKQAAFRDANEVQLRLDNWGSVRAQGNFNKVIIPNELAIRFDAVKEEQKFQQKPAFEDNDRLYTALRWEPGFLKKGSARTILRASFENGNIESNRPRTVPPLDRITPWFLSGTYQGIYKQRGSVPGAPDTGVYTVPVLEPGDPLDKYVRNEGFARIYNHLNRETFNPFQVQDDNTGRVNHGQQRPVINGGELTGYFNPSFNPWIGNFGDQFGGPNSFYADGNATRPASSFVWEGPRTRGINTAGQIDGDLGRSFHRPVGIARYDQFATNAGLPYYLSGLYKGRSLIDPTVFDFYNNLIDGPNKAEWNDWKVYNLSLAQTFMDDKFGFEVNYQNEEFTRGNISLLTGDRQAIYIDINSVYSDGTPAGANGEPFQDGTPNPNVGRPFISDSGRGGNSEYTSEREALRITGFVTHDFARNKSTVLNRILGKHTITGLYSEDEQVTDNRSWQRYAIIDDAYRAFLASTAPFTDNAFAVNRVIYLGPSLSNRSTASGAYIPRPTALQSVDSTLTIRTFDSTWIHPLDPTAPGYVNPADPWENLYYPEGHGSRASFQADNPLNYRGFTNRDVNVVDSETSRANRDLLTTGAQLSKSKVESKAFVWQGYFWDKSIVGTFGYREDTAKAWGKSLTSQAAGGQGHIDLSPTNYVLPDQPSNVLKVESRSYSIVAHLNQLPFLSSAMEKLPFELTFFYNKSSNFQPAASRVDLYGEPLAAPEGKTIDRGLLIETKDGRFSLKLNKYATELKNANSSAITNAWFIGASQAWTGNWANRFEYDFVDTDNNRMTIDYQANNRPADAPNPAGWSPMNRAGVADYDPTNSLYNYGADVGETQEQAAAREKAAVDGWRAWQAKVDPRFYAAWGIDLNAPFRQSGAEVITAATPQGFTVPEDSYSSGYEIEFNANPTRNWRLTFNATKTEAVRTDVGGENLGAFIDAYQEALTTTAAGDLRIWWGGAGNDTTLRQWYHNADSQVGPDWNFKALQRGQNVPELRKWRFNAITNYTFSEGALRGFHVGGGVRWQDKVGIGIKPFGDPFGGTFTIDPNEPNFYGPRETNFDAWVGYTRRLSRTFFSRNVEWSIQLNVSNIGKGNELIPVTVQPDGSYGTFRIAPHQYFTLTNSLKF